MKRMGILTLGLDNEQGKSTFFFNFQAADYLLQFVICRIGTGGLRSAGPGTNRPPLRITETVKICLIGPIFVNFVSEGRALNLKL